MKWLSTAILGGLIVGLLNLTHYFLSPGASVVSQHFAISVGGFWATSMAGIEKDILGKNVLFAGLPTYFRTLIPGIVIGSFFMTLWTKKGYSIIIPNKKDSIRALGGGVLIGFGVLFANGCIIKHLLSGVPATSLSSFVSVIGIVGGIIYGIKFVENRGWY